MLAKAAKAVSFLATVWLFWWSLPLCGLAMYLPWFRLLGRRNDIFAWGWFMMDCLFAKVHVVGKQRILLSDRPVMYLANHRSWADFFVDVYILGGRAMIMSRMAVCYVFPIFMIPVSLVKGILLFKRNLVRDKDAFNSWLDEKRGESLLNAMLVYPEGHRNTNPTELLPIKRGMLHYAYTRKMLVQVCMSSGKEQVLSEKRLSVGFGVDVVTSFSEPIDPNDHKDAASFIAEVQRSFEGHWRTVLKEAPNAASLPIYNPKEDLELYEYPMPMRLKMIGLLLSFSVTLFAMLYVIGWLVGPLISITALSALCGCIWIAASQ